MAGSVTPLLETPVLTLGEFRCPPDDDAWHETNLIGDRPHIVFPRIPVLIRQVGDSPVLATANETMLYNAEQYYERELRHAAGDSAVYLELPHESLALLAEEGAALVGRNYRLLASHAPAGSRMYLLQYLLVRYLRRPGPNVLLAEEAAAALARSALGARRGATGSRRSRTRAAHRELVEAAKAELSSAPGTPLGLHELAQRLHCSAFHLARVFRAQTGFTLHGFRHTLRMRAGLERVSSHAGELSALALELGFASHSHFSERFRNEFGFAPSRVGDERRVPALLTIAARG